VKQDYEFEEGKLTLTRPYVVYVPAEDDAGGGWAHGRRLTPGATYANCSDYLRPLGQRESTWTQSPREAREQGMGG
jgi:hypothetical protein